MPNPARTIAAVLVAGGDVQAAIDAWARTARTVIDLHRQARTRCLMVDAKAASENFKSLVQRLEEHGMAPPLSLPTIDDSATDSITSRHWNMLLGPIAEQMLNSDRDIRNLVQQVEAGYTPLNVSSIDAETTSMPRAGGPAANAALISQSLGGAAQP